jgi:integrase
MQAQRTHALVTVKLSKTCNGKPRKTPVWAMRYVLPSGKDSRKVLGTAWTKRGRPPHGYLTEGEAIAQAQTFAASHETHKPNARHTFRVALDRFVRYCRQEKGLRGSTLHEYERIGERLAERSWRSDSTWADRVLDTFSEDDLLVVRRELVAAERSADTLNHHRRVIRGIFGTHPTSPALAWAWMEPKVESEGKLRFYTPEQVDRLIAEAYDDEDVAIFTVASEAGARMSEIRALKVSDVDFAVEVIRLEDGYTTHGGFAGNKGRRTRSVPMSANVRRVLWRLYQGRDGEELVFQRRSRPGEPIVDADLSRRFIGACKRAGLPQISFHELRHTFGTQAIRKFKIHEVQRMLGHRHVTTTEKYLHYAPDSEASAKLTELWGDRGDPGRSTPPAPAVLPDSVVPLRRVA